MSSLKNLTFASHLLLFFLPTAGNPSLSDLLPSEPKQFIPVRDVYRFLLEGGASYYFKSVRDEDLDEHRYAYVPLSELAVYKIQTSSRKFRTFLGATASRP